jgi:Zn-dependent protease
MFNRSLRIGSLAGIDVHLHWSLLLGCAYFYFITFGTEAMAAMLVLSIFLSIVAHEFGHALVARWLGYPTRQIVLWMLGGVAIFDGEPRRARERIAIYAAGPLINLAIAAILAGLGYVLAAHLGQGWSRIIARDLRELNLPPLNLSQFGGSVIGMNLALALFNLLPIYPLDGGRIVRTMLARWIGERIADGVVLGLGLLLTSGLMLFFALQEVWLAVGEMSLLLLVVATLNPWFGRQVARVLTWLFYRGNYYAFYQQDYARAMAYADKQTARNAHAPAPHLLRSYLFLKMDNLPAAWAAADAAVQLCPTPTMHRAMALNNRGTIAWLQGDEVAARVDFDQAIQANATLAHAYCSRGELAAHHGDVDLAMADLTTAIEHMPQLLEAHYHRAALRFAQGDLAGARADAMTVFASNQPELPKWGDVELQHIVANRIPWARQIVAWAEAPGWSHAHALSFLGDTLRLNGHASEAVATYTQALATSPTDATLLARRALAHQSAGALDLARADIKQALAGQLTPWSRQHITALRDSLASDTTTPKTSGPLPSPVG